MKKKLEQRYKYLYLDALFVIFYFVDCCPNKTLELISAVIHNIVHASVTFMNIV